MSCLLDVNVLVALTWPTHVHHHSAVAWFTDQHADGWATCPATEAAFVRLSSNPALTVDAASPADAIAVLAELRRVEGHAFWTDRISLVTSELIERDHLVGHRQVSDAHLLAVALDHEGQLATFDRGVGLLTGRDEAVVLIPHRG